MAYLKYEIVENFITVDEVEAIKNYLRANKDNCRCYAEFHTIRDDILRTSYLKLDNVEDTIKELIDTTKRAQDYCKVPHINYHTINGWGISYMTQGQEVHMHRDEIDEEEAKTKKIIRMNMIIQEASRGGKFCLMDGDRKEIIRVPERALFIFDSSIIVHSVTKNLGIKPRINLSIDSVVDR